MNDLNKVFAYEDGVVRVLGTRENPLFVAGDVCRILGLSHVSSALRTYPEDEKGMYRMHTLGGDQDVLVVTEAGLYRLIFRSDKPGAKAFQNWVFKEVLPAIRVTGGYAKLGHAPERLWEAYDQARSARVQLAVLQSLGIGAGEAAANTGAWEVRQGLPALDHARLWKDAGELARAGTLAAGWHRVVAGHLFFTPEPVLEALWVCSAERYGALDRRGWRMRLEGVSAWVPGDHRHRLGEGRAVMACWCLRLDDPGYPYLAEFGPAGELKVTV